MESEIYGGHIFMKKILSFILATVLLLSLAACSKESANGGSPTENQSGSASDSKSVF